MSKIVDVKNVNELCAKLRSSGKKIVFTNGCFDILHAGHIDYMERSKALGDVLFVGVNSDASIKRIKGNTRPIVNQNFRTRALSGLSSVDYICVFEEDTPEDLIRMVNPNVLVKGMDWKGKKIAGQDFVSSNGGKVDFIEFLDGISTSIVIDNILKSHGLK